MRQAKAWIIILLLVDVTALADVATGSKLWFGPVYLFAICGATWLLGWRQGFGVGIFCLVIGFAINGTAVYPYGSASLSWDMALRLIIITFLISAIAAIRSAFVREWWLARTEPLTGALNRQAFFEFADIMCRSQEWRLLMYADLDRLKAINDQHGHAAGDLCLKAYSDAVKKAIRRGDVFARMGGDEFVIFMTVKDEAGARSAATRLHRVMNNVSTELGGYLGCSVGALLLPPGTASSDVLVRHADTLMYKAKQQGAALEFGMASPVHITTSKSNAGRSAIPTANAAPVIFNPARERRKLLAG